MASEDIIRINISIPKALKEKWEIYADEHGYSISGLIRLSVNEFIESKEKEQNGRNLAIIQQQLDSKIDQKMNEFAELFKKLKPKAEEIEEEKNKLLKAQIIGILEDHPKGLEPKTLAKYCGISRETMLSILGELKEIGSVKMEKGVIILNKEDE